MGSLTCKRPLEACRGNMRTLITLQSDRDHFPHPTTLLGSSAAILLTRAHAMPSDHGATHSTAGSLRSPTSAAPLMEREIHVPLRGGATDMIDYCTATVRCLMFPSSTSRRSGYAICVGGQWENSDPWVSNDLLCPDLRVLSSRVYGRVTVGDAMRAQGYQVCDEKDDGSIERLASCHEWKRLGGDTVVCGMTRRTRNRHSYLTHGHQGSRRQMEGGCYTASMGSPSGDECSTRQPT